MLGEAVNVIMRMIVFDPMFGFFTLLHLWIDYIVYARMDFCFSFMTIFMAGWDLMQIGMHVMHKDFKEKHLDSTHKQVLLYIIIGYSIFRMVAFVIAYKVFKLEFLRTYGHVNPCGGFGDDDQYGRPMPPRPKSLFSVSEPSNPQYGNSGNRGGFAMPGGQHPGHPNRGWNNNSNLYAQPQQY